MGGAPPVNGNADINKITFEQLLFIYLSSPSKLPVSFDLLPQNFIFSIPLQVTLLYEADQEFWLLFDSTLRY